MNAESNKTNFNLINNITGMRRNKFELTRGEEEVMHHIWNLKEATVSDIIDLMAEPKPKSIEESVIESARTIMRGGIEDIITEWSQREDKPFVQESITLLDVAEETKLSPRLLSEFLNKYYKVNFCTWINTLRVEEVKRLLIEQPSLSIADISVMVGFSDPASLSKIFKKISNESPSAYKKRLSA